jgi:hypothetical protein
LFAWLKLPLPSLGYTFDWIITMSCSLGFAYVFYLLVEKPSHQLARKIQVYSTRKPLEVVVAGL